jgi:TIR domain
MAAKVFISYRRDDSAGHAGRIHDRLVRDLGRSRLFMDVDNVPLGENFVEFIRAQVASCNVLLALIGPNWLDATDESGNRRLNSPHDYVRLEVATALQRNIPVIPILLDGARIPTSDQLPSDLAGLSLRNGLETRHSSFHSDMDTLVRSLTRPITENLLERLRFNISTINYRSRATWLDVLMAVLAIPLGLVVASALLVIYNGLSGPRFSLEPPDWIFATGTFASLLSILFVIFFRLFFKRSLISALAGYTLLVSVIFLFFTQTLFIGISNNSINFVIILFLILGFGLLGSLFVFRQKSSQLPDA